ncbi:hypothetical protein M2323_004133 [Rhodoblastus acidophilus]|uniref:hypothetical protein n=1 Tax=Rhodoblastus acidophilus TaxID=1074 RepID=UPI0016164B53|nr:hypothetical protein [Rhodoblastus acidophilus]MCW2286292.1 hypothetical protein [Rhodoblastus acidophilus]MCW2335187.1 hypothetical protein [Rhodoblastus acidophilus]
MTEVKAMIASVKKIAAKDRRRLPFMENIAKMLDWGHIAGPVVGFGCRFQFEALSQKSGVDF